MIYLAVLLAVVSARDFFPPNFPNGANVEFDGSIWRPLGHIDRINTFGGDGLNPFGQAVAAQLANGIENVWPLICDIDSDNDGRTNGEELLDPTCIWRSIDDNDRLEEGIPTHPGFIDGPGVEPEVPPKLEIPVKLKIHIAFMTLAWLVFAPVGVLTAVVLKVRTKSVTAVNWFKIHKICVGTAVYLTLIAYFCIVYVEEGFELESPHTRLGHAVLFLAIIQPISGFWRVHINEDGSKSYLRLAWEYFHQFTGRILLILAVANLYLGYDLDQVGFINEGGRTAMKIISIAGLIIGGIFCVAYVIFRTDERKQPELPTKKEEEQPTVAEKKEDTNKKAQEQGKMAETSTEKQEAQTTEAKKEDKPAETKTAAAAEPEKKKEEVTTS